MSKPAIGVLTAPWRLSSKISSLPLKASSLPKYSGGIAAPCGDGGSAPPSLSDGQPNPPVTGSRNAA